MVIALSILATAAGAECQICDRVARLDEVSAKCFLARYDRVQRQSGDPLMVNLAECTPGRTGRGPVAPLPRPKTDVQPISEVLIVERQKLSCIRQRLITLGTAAKWPVDIDLNRCG